MRLDVNKVTRRIGLALLLIFAVASASQAQSDPLPSWNGGAIRKVILRQAAILNYVNPF
jgi:hypothetical protein